MFVVIAAATVQVAAVSQSLSKANEPSGYVTSATATKLDLTYARPTERTKVSNYLFDAYGPYPIVGAGVAAGINQLENASPE